MSFYCTDSFLASKMTIDVKTSSVYWCAFFSSKLKSLGQIKQHEIRFKCLHQGQIKQGKWPGSLVEKSGQLQVSSKSFAPHILDPT